MSDRVKSTKVVKRHLRGEIRKRSLRILWPQMFETVLSRAAG